MKGRDEQSQNQGYPSELTIWPAVGRAVLAVLKLVITVVLPFAYLALRVCIELMSWAVAIGLGLVVGMIAAILGVRTPRVLFVYHLGRRSSGIF